MVFTFLNSYFMKGKAEGIPEGLKKFPSLSAWYERVRTQPKILEKLKNPTDGFVDYIYWDVILSCGWFSFSNRQGIMSQNSPLVSQSNIIVNKVRLKRFDCCWSLIVFLDLIKHNSCGHSKPLAHLLCSSHRKFYQLFCFKTHGKSVHNFPPCFVFLCIYSCVLVFSLWYFMFSPMGNPGLPIWILVLVNVVTVSISFFFSIHNLSLI